MGLINLKPLFYSFDVSLRITLHFIFYKILRISCRMQFEMAQAYFKSAEGGLLVDVSCGSGLFSRKFAKFGNYSGVIALDFSENMLRQCYDFIKSDGTLLTA